MSTDQNEKTLLLGTESVTRLLWSYALPAIAAMVASSLYNIVDGIFISHLGAYNISAVGLCAPFMNLAAAFGSLIGVGSSVLCSIFLGEKNYDKARLTLGNLILLNLITGILVTVFGFMFLDPILLFFGASENTLPAAHDYMLIILAGNVFSHMYLGLNSVLRVSGAPVLAMSMTFLSVGINIVLAPIFIFYLGLGIRGAALATVIAQVACCIALFYIMMQRTRAVYIERDKITFSAPIIRRSLAIGSPNFATHTATCFIVVLQNHFLLTYGSDLHIGAFSIVNRVITLFFLIILGFSQGMQPIVAYNFGAKKYSRMWQAFRVALLCSLCVTTAGTFACEFLPEQLTSIFVSGEGPLDSQLFEITVTAFRILGAAFWIIATQAIGSNFFASMNQPHKSMFLSLTRQLLFLVPLLFILPSFFDINGVWYAVPFSDVLAALCAAALLWREWNRQKNAGMLADANEPDNNH